MAHSIIFTGLPLIRKLDRPPIGFLGTGRRVFERTPVTNLGSDVDFPFVKTWACACRPGLSNLLFLDRINIGISCSTTALHWLGKKDEAAIEMEKAPSSGHAWTRDSPPTCAYFHIWHGILSKLKSCRIRLT
jgi:hypothetical protein